MSPPPRALPLVLLVLVSPACRPAPPSAPPAVALRDTHEGLNSLLWVQTAAEYEASCLAVYRLATAALGRGLADRTWTAAVEQTGDIGRLPPAVILDLDETVFDNSRFQGQLVADRAAYSEDAWRRWVNRVEAGAVPGVTEFLKYADARRVAIFYISSREAAEEAATRANLVKLGLPVDAAGDRVLSKGERPDWGSDKRSRRAAVAATHRIVLLIGDDLGDFVEGSRDTPENRMALSRRYADRWGVRWFLLPNPMYGSWERATYGLDAALPDADVLKRKMQLVKRLQ